MQGFASDGIHKTIGVFLKNAKNRKVFVRRQPLSLNRAKNDEAISREGGFPLGIYYFTLVVGYFADAQYDGVFLFYVILNDSEESHRRTDEHIILTLVVGYFADAQYDVFFVFASVAKQSPGRAEFYGVYLAFFFEGIAAALRASQ